MPLHIENSTHWRTPDIRRLVNAAIKGAGADPKVSRKVVVTYNVTRVKGSKKLKTKSRLVPLRDICFTASNTLNRGNVIIKLRLPKIGPKDLHPNAMLCVALAASVDPDRTILAPGQTFWLANALAAMFSVVTGSTGDWATLIEQENSMGVPTWAKPEDLFIYKVMDPLQDGTYLDFVAKKRTKLAQIEASLTEAEALIATTKLKLAKLNKKKIEIERSLKTARERRS